MKFVLCGGANKGPTVLKIVLLRNISHWKIPFNRFVIYTQRTTFTFFGFIAVRSFTERQALTSVCFSEHKVLPSCL